MADYYPEGELDPVAAGIAGFFATDAKWLAMPDTPVAETRAGVRAAQAVSGEPEMARVEDHLVPAKGGEIVVRSYRPHGEVRALILWAHGGGFCLGSIDEADNFCRALAVASKCAVASIDYRLAPEHIFPTAVEDVEAAALWALARVFELAGAGVPVVLGGDSAGGNLATVVTRRLHAAGTARLTANVLAYPCTDAPDAPSLFRFEPPFLTMRECGFFLAQYLPDRASWRHPDCAPLHAEGLAVLPPTFVITASHDILTEQAEAYAEKLQSLGVEVRVSRHAGMIHGFLTLDPFFPGAAGTAMDEIGAFIADVTANA